MCTQLGHQLFRRNHILKGFDRPEQGLEEKAVLHTGYIGVAS